ncbi:hypothetical protein [Paenibacillus peoriae]|nr:hypothetical protein [Paenibacillus peoriae]
MDLKGVMNHGELTKEEMINDCISKINGMIQLTGYDSSIQVVKQTFSQNTGFVNMSKENRITAWLYLLLSDDKNIIP